MTKLTRRMVQGTRHVCWMHSLSEKSACKLTDKLGTLLVPSILESGRVIGQHLQLSVYFKEWTTLFQDWASRFLWRLLTSNDRYGAPGLNGWARRTILPTISIFHRQHHPLSLPQSQNEDSPLTINKSLCKMSHSVHRLRNHNSELSVLTLLLGARLDKRCVIPVT